MDLERRHPLGMWHSRTSTVLILGQENHVTGARFGAGVADLVTNSLICRGKAGEHFLAPVIPVIPVFPVFQTMIVYYGAGVLIGPPG